MIRLAAAALLALFACTVEHAFDPGAEPARLAPSEVGMVVGNTAGDLRLLDDLAITGVGWVRLDHGHTEDIRRAASLGLRTYVTLHEVAGRKWTEHVREQVAGHPSVSVWGILNEAHAYLSAEEYVERVIAAAPIIRAAGARLAAPEADQLNEPFVREVMRLASESIDIISVHHYGSAEASQSFIDALPGDQPVWLTEAAYNAHQTPSQQAQHLRQTFRAQCATPRWQVTMPYHWYADRNFPIRGTPAEDVFRETLSTSATGVQP